MKKIIGLIFVIALALVMSVTAFAADRYVIDNTGTMTTEEIAKIEKVCKSISKEYSFDVIYVITDSTGGKSLERYTTDIYDDVCDYDDGVIFIFNTDPYLDEDEYNWALIGFGKGKKLAGKESTRDNLISRMKWDLKSGRYYDASVYYTDKVSSFVEDGMKGDPADPTDVAVRIVISLAVGLIVAFIITKKQKSKLTTAVKQRGAMNYISPNSAKINVARDMFLYSTTTRVRRESNSSGGGRGFGGTSGGGHSYSGGGGRI